MFAHDTFVALFGAVRPGDQEHLANLVRAALREGYAIVLNEPGTKKPLCTLSAAARKLADREAQDAAMERGEDNASARRHPCGIGHALTTDDAAKVTGLLTRVTKTYGAPPNIGIEPGASRLLVVDMDTAGQRDAFLAMWATEEPGEVPDADVLYTVRSPGKQDPDGTWAHKDGGHTWFRLPEGVTLPSAGRGVLTGEGGWSLIWSDLQVLVPPSVRAEGPYACVGMPRLAPRWMLERIEAEVVLRTERARLRLERRSARDPGELDPVDEWAAQTPWADLLEPRGWTATGRVDTCSCPTWTAPGPHGSPKSATAHDIGCAVFDADDGHAPMRVWTDNPPDYLHDAPRTLTKLTHEAYADYEGSESAAVIGLGLAVSDGGPMAVDNPFDLAPDGESIQDQSTTSPQTGDSERPGPSEEGPASDVDDPGSSTVLEPSGLAKVDSEPTEDVKDPSTPRPPGLLAQYDLDQLDALPDPQPLIHGLLNKASLAILSGKFGTYKSFLAVDWACHVALGRSWQGHDVDQATPVVYIAAEGQVGVKRRFRGWRKRFLADAPWPDPHAVVTIPQRVVLETDKDGKATAHLRELVELVRELGAGLVVFDTLSKSRGAKADENSNSDMAALMSLVIELIRATDACVLLVAHTGYSGEHTRGGSAQEDDADTVFTIKFEDPKSEDRSITNRRVLHHRKSKDEELIAPKVLVPQVEEIGQDDHGRSITTLTFTTDPFETVPGPTRAVSVESVLDELDRLNAPRGLTQRRMKQWMAGQDLAPTSHLRKRTATWWPVYSGEYSDGDSHDRESDDHGITSDQ